MLGPENTKQTVNVGLQSFHQSFPDMDLGGLMRWLNLHLKQGKPGRELKLWRKRRRESLNPSIKGVGR